MRKTSVYLAGLFSMFCLVVAPVVAEAPAEDSGSMHFGTAVDDRKTSGFAPILAPFYSPETGWGGAGSILAYWNADRSAARPDTWSIVAIYTQKKQMLFGANIDKYLWGDHLLIEAGAGYSDWQNTFYGIGGEPPPGLPETYEEEFVATTFRGDLGLAVRLMEGMYAGIQWFYGDTEIALDDPDGWPPESDVCGLHGGRISGPGITFTWDTRDEAFFPNRGFLFESQYSSYLANAGSEFDFDYALADLRFYHSLKRKHILALHAEYEYTDGCVPFYRLPSLANRGAMRGIEGGRYINRVRYAVQTEYRFPIRNRWGAVVFLGAGHAAAAHSELFDELVFAGGFGFRFAVETNKHINIRLDIGFDSDGDRKFYFTLREAF